MTINWKAAAKWYREQFLVWRDGYNELAEQYMIGASYSAGAEAAATFTGSFRFIAPDSETIGNPANDELGNEEIST